MHSWVREIQICSNEGKILFSRGDNYKIVKIYWQNWKILFKLKSSTTVSISTNLCAKHIWVKRIPVGSNEETFHSQNVDNGFSSINVMIKSCVYWFELFSQVSDVAHGPPVMIIIIISIMNFIIFIIIIIINIVIIVILYYYYHYHYHEEICLFLL